MGFLRFWICLSYVKRNGPAMPLVNYFHMCKNIIHVREKKCFTHDLVNCLWNGFLSSKNGALTRNIKLQAEHAPGMPGTFSLPPRVSDLDMHHGTCVEHVLWSMLGSLTSGFPWSRWQQKRSRHFRRMRNPQFYVSGKSPIDCRAAANTPQSLSTASQLV